jgi:hypothetical protein
MHAVDFEPTILSKRAAADLRLSPRGQWDGPKKLLPIVKAFLTTRVYKTTAVTESYNYPTILVNGPYFI